MSLLKWTGKGLQFVGRIISSEAFEDWLEAEGSGYLEAKLEEKTIGRFRKETKAKNQLLDDVESSISSEPLKLALLSRLVELPFKIESAAKEIKSSLPALSYEKSLSWIAAVPRYYVRRIYSEYILGELEAADELSKFTGFPSIYLRDLARDSESGFFERINKGNEVWCESGVILGVDPNYDWHLGFLEGHYYYASYGIATALDNRSAKNELKKDANSILPDFKIKLGLFTSEGKDGVAQVLKG